MPKEKKVIENLKCSKISESDKDSEEIGNTNKLKRKALGEKCAICKNIFEKRGGKAFCLECGKDFGCDECWPDCGLFCSQCNVFRCYSCIDRTGLAISPCDSCSEIYCEDCGNFKTKRDGSEVCSDCR
mmetsp:Transcript_23960/g.32963  ORF Transcript_23960/g.32963 Transcript_23960/m.32963 type:complete len:128 (+) Transcript_23960:187-570(+)